MTFTVRLKNPKHPPHHIHGASEGLTPFKYEVRVKDSKPRKQALGHISHRSTIRGPREASARGYQPSLAGREAIAL